ncbi:MAG TPA: MCE family protein, partial [Nocardioides sp.]|nr:MCE family protein [Nocardioides sp.]
MNQKIMRMLCATVLAAGVLLGSAGCGLGSKTITVHAYLHDSAGLFVGNDVGVLGVPVGKVTAIEPKGDQVEVTMEVDTSQPIPADASALVISRSVATDRYVELAPVYKAGEPKMADGGQILANRTRTPVDFDEVLAALNTFATGIGGSKKTTAAIRHFLNAGASALGGRGPLLNQTIHSLANGINGLAAQRGNVSATLTSLDHLVGTIAANQGTAKQFIRQVSAASTLLANERVNFRSALRS